MSKTLTPYLNDIRTELEHTLSAMEGVVLSSSSSSSYVSSPSKIKTTKIISPSKIKQYASSSSSLYGVPIHPEVELGNITSRKVIYRKHNSKSTKQRQKCFIEGSRNSVRCSFQLKYLQKNHYYKKQHDNNNDDSSSIITTSTINTTSSIITTNTTSSTIVMNDSISSSSGGGGDTIEQIICSRYVRFLQRRAEEYQILRRKPITVPVMNHNNDNSNRNNNNNNNNNRNIGVTNSCTKNISDKRNHHDREHLSLQPKLQRLQCTQDHDDDNDNDNTKNNNNNNNSIEEEEEQYDISFLIMNSHINLYGQEQIINIILSFLSNLDREINQVKISLNARARLVANEFMKAF